MVVTGAPRKRLAWLVTGHVGSNPTLSATQLPWCINTGKSLIPLTLLFLAQKRNLLIPLELSRVMHQGIMELKITPSVQTIVKPTALAQSQTQTLSC